MCPALYDGIAAHRDWSSCLKPKQKPLEILGTVDEVEEELIQLFLSKLPSRSKYSDPFRGSLYICVLMGQRDLAPQIPGSGFVCVASIQNFPLCTQDQLCLGM